MAQWKTFAALLFVIAALGICCSVFAQNQPKAKEVYYHIEGKDLAQTTSWTSQHGGKGSKPQNFASDSTLWIVSSDILLTGQWTVSGQNSRVLVSGNDFQKATLVLMPGSQLNAIVDVGPTGQLNILSDNYPRWGEMHEGSTVVFSLDKKIIPYHDFYNLTLLGITPVFKEDGDNTLKIRGSLTLEGDVVFPAARDAVRYNFLFYGKSTQKIDTNDNILRAWDIRFNKTEGLIRLMPNTNISADHLMQITISEEGLFQDNSTTYYVGNHLAIKGSESNFDLEGTFIMAGKEPGIVDGAVAGSTYTIASNDSEVNLVALPNIIIRANNRSGEFLFECPPGRNVIIKGNLLVEKQAAGTIRFCNQGVKFQGNYIVEEGFKGKVEPFNRIE